MAQEPVTLIYCAGGNPRNMALARSLGWLPGARSDDSIADTHRPLHMLDVHWTKYDWAKHLMMAKRERPYLGVVPDMQCADDLPRILAQAEDLAPHVEGAVLVVPKMPALVALIPPVVGGKAVRLAYSVPTRYGGAQVPMWEFAGRDVHLLGGSPKAQVTAAHYLQVVSADGNMAQKVSKWGMTYDAQGRPRTLAQLDGKRWPGGADMPTEALTRSLSAIPLYWQRSGFQTTIEQYRRSEVPA